MDYLSPTYLINNVSLNLLDTLPASFDFASGWVYALIGLPEQITNSFSLSPMLSATLGGGMDYLSWLGSTSLESIGLLPH
jgi:hypothetical protein